VILTGKQFEDRFEAELKAQQIPYIREGQQVRRGGAIGKGKYDFDIGNVAVECKCVNSLLRATYPRPSIKCPLIKPHQLKALRTKPYGYILVHDNSVSESYAITPSDLDKIIIEHGLVKSLKGYIEHNKVDIKDFVAVIKAYNQHESTVNNQEPKKIDVQI